MKFISATSQFINTDMIFDVIFFFEITKNYLPCCRRRCRHYIESRSKIKQNVKQTKSLSIFQMNNFGYHFNPNVSVLLRNLLQFRYNGRR